MAYKGTGLSVEEIGRALEVGTVLEGSVRRAEDRLRVSVQLVDVQSQEHLWSEDYNRELQDVLAVQSEIAQRVAEALQVELLAGEAQQLGKKATENLEAYDLYWKGRYFWNRRSEQAIRTSMQYFQQAIDLDTTYALAWVGLADAYNTLGVYNFLPPEESHPKARTFASRALQIDEELAEAHTSMAAVLQDYYWNWPE